VTVPGLGNAQGVTVFGGQIYLYGDSDTGILREFVFAKDGPPHLATTGRVVQLTRDNTNLLNHPTGLALHDGLPCFLGNTITATKQGKIYRLDLARALAEGTLDHAVLNETLDDLAVQGSRPEYVRYHGRELIATSDYGAGPNFVRFYDPVRLATALRTSEPGVLVRRVPCGPWVQLLHWVQQSSALIIVENITAGRGWRLTFVSNLDAADYRGGAGVRVVDFPKRLNELEGYARISDEWGVFITSS